jgi:hypothetical protein
MMRVALERIFITGIEPSSTIISNEREYRKSPTSTLGAPQGIGGGAATAHAGHVDHVVMQQGGGVQEFDGGGQQAQVVAFAAQGLATQQHQQRAQALAAGGRDIVADFRYQRHARGQLLLDDPSTALNRPPPRGRKLGVASAAPEGCAAC